jgi:hypothetical protein
MSACRRVVPTMLVLLVGAGAQSRPASPGADPFTASAAARDGGRYAMLLRQLRADEPALGDRHVAGPRPALAGYQGEKDIPAGHWVWARPYWFVFRDGPATASSMRSWGPEQACGEPNTSQPGDCSTAWATREMERAGEWLLLEYDAPILGAAIEVHETYHPGAVAAVSVFLADGEERELWRATQVGPVADAGRVLKVDLPLGFRFQRVKLHIASDAVPSWNEIDAVGVRDAKGKLHWAARAEASSTYAEVAAAPGPAALGPAAPVAVPLVAPPAPVARALPPRDPAQARIAALEATIAALEARIAALEAEVARLRATPPQKR